ncbi:MAG TPA: STT3 domain-containing protein [Candidatus Nanoarchaeia archaeon]|nr:STT3 domain-containing protein [Candidatus Nanoarchaeia archaeon]
MEDSGLKENSGLSEDSSTPHAKKQGAEEEIDLKINYKKIIKIFSNKKLAVTLTVIALVFFLVLGSWIRTQNIPTLKDQTNGEYVLSDIDAFYYLRIADQMLGKGKLPQYDNFRYYPNIPFSDEILPHVLVGMFKLWIVWDETVTIQYISVIYPVVFFFLGLIVFFFLTYVLTNSKTIAVLSTAFLSLTPTYLFRTMAGVSDHEPIGMFAFFGFMLVFTLALKAVWKEKSNYKIFGLSVLTGVTTAITIAAWGGISNFIYMIAPLSFFIVWFVKLKQKTEENKKSLEKFLILYITWILSSVIFLPILGNPLTNITGRMFSATGIISLFVLGFIIIDYLLILFFANKDLVKKKRIILDIILTIVLGLAFLFILKGEIGSLYDDAVTRLLHPFGVDRVSTTVAENAQPYLNDWINQVGKRFFWLFFIGLAFFGVKIVEGIRKLKNKAIFSLTWILLVIGLLFSRTSSSSILNGTNFISKLLYFGSIVLFFIVCIYLYKRDEIKISSETAIVFSWLVFMLISVRGAVRLFFVVAPFVCFIAAYFVVNLLKYARERKEEVIKIILIIGFVAALIVASLSLYDFYKSSSNQAKFTGPSAGPQWQSAMAWVRNNTQEDAVFVHWWDYGYWIQALGKRATLADGGHFEGAFRDHLVGRYLLTTPNPETALSFMKSNNATHLLIDPTDIGKYSAYASIGSDASSSDRLSWIPIMSVDMKQTQETANGTIRLYQGGTLLDQDIIYELDGKRIYLPANNAGIGAIVSETKSNNGTISFSQPEGIFVYNNNQMRIPLRYLYYEDRILDFKSGVNSIVYILPMVYQSGQGYQKEELGGAIYLSERTAWSLVGQLYLLNDPFDNYTNLKLVHAEPDPAVSYFNSQGANIKDFVLFNGLRGPIKIWEYQDSENILSKDEFLQTSGEYAEFDNLEFKTK